MYHELREKDAVLQNVEDPNMRAELEREFEEQSASTKRHTICVMRLIGMLFMKKMITLTILCEGFMNRVLYAVTRYCFTWWTCGHAAHASSLRFRPSYVDDRSTLVGSHTIRRQRRSSSNLMRSCLMAKIYQRLAALFSLSQE
ncbi:hypothetical protein Tsp_14603 [Trichinella spiralis]|uniref:hypothetical protein n=1 Tax=Trichinella spiralis TaxID=6334 RepID=UPI0001EFD297|nr:hypothetical protein Tsp_14603 [Trichinella spiralis]